MDYRHARKLLIAAVGTMAVTGAVALYGGAASTSKSRGPGPAPAPASTSATRIALPTSGTVLTLQGALGTTSDVRKSFGGRFTRAPYKTVDVAYPANLSSRSITVGVERLDAALKKTSGTIIVLAHGQGAQVASRWMRLHSNDSKAPGAERLTFVLTGNPLRAAGGSGIGAREVDGAIGAATPTDAKWPIVDVARRYDGWADAPADSKNKDAVKNAQLGKLRFHGDYAGIDLADPSLAVWKTGSTTFALTQEQVPSWDTDDNVASSNYVQLRQRTEAGFRRPSADAGTYRPGCAPGVDPSAQAGKRMSGTSLPIPASATVLTLSGLNFNLYHDMHKKFQGVFATSPYCMIQVNYPASIANDSITTGVANLDAMLRSIPGPKIVLGQSQGAQTASRWMRQFRNDPTAPKADEVTFLLTGNPLRSAGGGDAIGKKEVDKTIGQPTPTDTKWPIVDVTRRYEGWADAPNDRSNAIAVENAEAGKKIFHKAYDVVDIRANTHTTWTKGNTTYVLTKEDVLPIFVGKANVPSDIEAMYRGRIEAAYVRPSNDPKVRDLGPVSVATLEGLIMPQGYTERQLNGFACTAPFTCQRIKYTNTGSRASINDGVAKLNAWIRSTPGQKIVLGYSLGATVANAWLRQYGTDASAPGPDQLRFVLTGNPERVGTTKLSTDPSYGGIPANTRYRVTDICRKWDAVCYKIPGERRSLVGTMALHLDYTKVDPFAADNEVTTTGNIQSVLIPTPGWG